MHSPYSALSNWHKTSVSLVENTLELPHIVISESKNKLGYLNIIWLVCSHRKADVQPLRSKFQNISKYHIMLLLDPQGIQIERGLPRKWTRWFIWVWEKAFEVLFKEHIKIEV